MFEGPRVRHCLYAPDLAEIVASVARRSCDGFNPCNLPGTEIAVGALARAIVRLAGRGRIETAPMPDHIRAIELGAATFVGARLAEWLGTVPETPFDEAMTTTIYDLRSRLMP